MDFLLGQYLSLKKKFRDWQRIFFRFISWVCICFHRYSNLKGFPIILSMVVFINIFIFRWSIWVWISCWSVWLRFLNVKTILCRELNEWVSECCICMYNLGSQEWKRRIRCGYKVIITYNVAFKQKVVGNIKKIFESAFNQKFASRIQIKVSVWEVLFLTWG